MTCEGCDREVSSRSRGGGILKRFCSERCRNATAMRRRRAAGLIDRALASEQSRVARHRREFGMESEDYETLLAAQGGVCALCQRPESRSHGRLAVDHDHATGEIRGLLCASCNTALGRLGDSAEGIRRVLTYVRGDARRGGANPARAALIRQFLDG